MNLLFITGHIMGGPRKVSFLFYAEKAAQAGESVSVLTVGHSCISVFKNWLGKKKPADFPVNQWVQVAPRTESFYWRSWWHPVKPYLRLTEPLYRGYGSALPLTVKEKIRNADVIVIESGTPIFLIPVVQRWAPRAKLVYRATDRLGPLKSHPLLETLLAEAESAFDLIVCPAEVQLQDFKRNPNVIFIPQGLEKSGFAGEYSSPFTQTKQAISVGDMLFDDFTLRTLAQSFPDWTFHLFGRNARLANALPNVVEHGEVPFNTLIPYLKFADIGIAPYLLAPDIDYIAQSSLKMTQYTYCHLPIVAPEFAVSKSRPHICAYQPGEAPSIQKAFTQAMAYERSSIDSKSIKSWDELWLDLKAALEKIPKK